MIIFLYGTDGYARARKAKWWAEEYRRKHGHSPAMRFDMAEENALSALREFCGSASMFDASMLAVLENVFTSPEGAPLAQFLQARVGDEERVIIVSEEKKPPAPFAFLLAATWSEKFDAPRGASLSAFVQKEAARRGMALDAAAERLLVGASGGDTWWIATELDRAALLGTRTLTPRDFPELDLGRRSVEELLSAFRFSSRGDRLAILEKLFGGRHEPAKLFNRLAYRDPRKLPAFAAYDVLVKSGKLDYEEALLALAVS